MSVLEVVPALLVVVGGPPTRPLIMARGVKSSFAASFERRGLFLRVDLSSSEESATRPRMSRLGVSWSSSLSAILKLERERRERGRDTCKRDLN